MADKIERLDFSGLSHYDGRLKEWVGKQNSDWDATVDEKGFIKNKPFGNLQIDIFNITPDQTESNNGMFEISVPVQSAGVVQAGKTYYLNLDGEEAECVFYQENDGSLNCAGVMPQSRMKFTLTPKTINGQPHIVFSTRSKDFAHKKVRFYEYMLKRIDSQFMPESVASKEYVDEKIDAIDIPIVDVPTPDWEASEGEDGFIKNRPFGDNVATKVVDFTPDMVDDGAIVLQEPLNGYFASAIGDKDTFKKGSVYLVKFGDFPEQMVECKSEMGVLYLNDADSQFNWEVALKTIEGMPSLVFFCVKDFLGQTITVKSVGLKTLDTKYLPEDAATKEYVLKEIGDALEITTEDLTRPPRAFIDMWNEACGEFGKYNEETGYFELNGLTDITYQQALTIHRDSANIRVLSNRGGMFSSARTLFPITACAGSMTDEAERSFYGSWSLEAIRFKQAVYGITQNTFQVCGSLKNVYGAIFVNGIQPFPTSSQLEYAEIMTSEGLDLSPNGNLNLETFEYILANASNSGPITIKVHFDVFDKFKTNSEWTDLRRKLTEKNISITYY